MRRFHLVLCAALLYFGCSSSSGGVAGGGSTPPVPEPPPPAEVTLTELQVEPGRAVLPSQLRVELTARGLFSDGSVRDLTDQVTWSSSDSSVASIQAEGLAQTLNPGQTTLQATLDGQSDSAELTVSGATLTRLEVTPAFVLLPVGFSQPLAARGMFSDGTTLDLTDQVTWSSRNSDVAVVDSNGSTQGRGVGRAGVEATRDGLVAQSHIQVDAAQLLRLDVEPGTLAVGTSRALRATGVFSNQSQLDVSAQVAWSSLDPAVASVEGTRATGRSAGSTRLSASLAGLTGEVDQRVTDATLSALTITPSEPVLAENSNLQLEATGVFADGTRQDLTDAVFWRSNALAFEHGRALAGAAPGAAQVQAVLGPITGEVSARVVDASRIQHLVVIFSENRSFDHYFGFFPGANGLANAGAATVQTDMQGVPYPQLPPPLRLGVADPRFPTLPNGPFEIQPFVPFDVDAANSTGSPSHAFYQEQYQIHGGLMDRFVAWAGVGAKGVPLPNGLTMGTYSGAGLPLEKLAAQFVLCDNYFHSAFGGSMLNHQWLVAAKTPVFRPRTQDPAPPDDEVAVLDENGVLIDHFGPSFTPDGYAINAFSQQLPPPAYPVNRLVPPQTTLCIGDLLLQANVDFAWYAQGWNNVLAGTPDKGFQYHHQPFAYFKTFDPLSSLGQAHLRDLDDFKAALAQKTPLKPVSFIKFRAPLNEHPGGDLDKSQKSIVSLIQGVMAHPDWDSTVIVICYDEHGGFWDHVAPPVRDRWGPGTRVPALVISPFGRNGSVDHAEYENLSVLKLIESRWGLGELGPDGKSDNLLHTLSL